MFDSAISKPLHLTFDICISLGEFPDGWKNATNHYQKKVPVHENKQQTIYKLLLTCFFIAIFQKDIWKSNI